MRKVIVLIAIILSGLSLSAQSGDTTHYLFRNLSLSYVQFTMGYERINFGPGDGLGGFYWSLFGLAFNEKISIGLDLDAANRTYNSFLPSSTFPKTATYLGFGLNIEPLITPKKLINFSVPLRAGIADAARWDTTFEADHNFLAGYSSSQLSRQVNEYNYTLLYFSGGVNAFVNLWRAVSFGGGVAYRYTTETANKTSSQDFSGMSYSVLLRLKFDYKAYNKKMIERYRQFYQQAPPPSTGNQ